MQPPAKMLKVTWDALRETEFRPPLLLEPAGGLPKFLELPLVGEGRPERLRRRPCAEQQHQPQEVARSKRNGSLEGHGSFLNLRG